VSQIRLYLDEDSVEKSLIKAFCNANLDVVTVADVSRQSYSDDEQLIWATEQGRAIYSYNRRDFCCLHNEFLATERNHACQTPSQHEKLFCCFSMTSCYPVNALSLKPLTTNSKIFLRLNIQDTDSEAVAGTLASVLLIFALMFCVD
jgi:hypothetical protein